MININETGEKTKIFIPRDKIDGKLNNDCDLSTKLEKLADILVNIENIKTDIKNAIENKNVEVGDISFNEYADKIDDISYINFECIGYNKQLSNELNSEINEPLLYSKQLFNEWDKNTKTIWDLYKNDKQLVYAPNIDISNVTDIFDMFSGCSNLKIVPAYNTPNVTFIDHMFNNCTSLKSVPLFDISKVYDFISVFFNCSSLTTIPKFNTSNVKNMNYTFYGCTSLQSIPELDCGNLKYLSSFWGGIEMTNLTDLGGFKNLKASASNFFLDVVPNVTVDSLLNVINDLYDWGNNIDGKAVLNNGEIFNFGTTHTLKFGQVNLDKLTFEQIAIAINKGWTLTA